VNLTKEQLEQAKSGQPVEIADKGDEFILIRKDLYDLGRRATDDWDPRDAYPLVNEAMREDDASDPLLDSYEKYRP
jgi:hypothetical protein